jgi:ParB family transcriptional regulator, chromosome partitioning protein
VVSSIQDIPLGKIHESKTNPRRQFDEKELAELAANIKQHGVLQPILVRPLPKGIADSFELVAGARRYRASKLAGRKSIPATVRELTDAEALEVQVIENVQRVDVHPLDEAQGYAALLELQPQHPQRRKHRFPSWHVASICERTAALASAHFRSEASVL